VRTKKRKKGGRPFLGWEDWNGLPYVVVPIQISRESDDLTAYLNRMFRKRRFEPRGLFIDKVSQNSGRPEKVPQKVALIGEDPGTAYYIRGSWVRSLRDGGRVHLKPVAGRIYRDSNGFQVAVIGLNPHVDCQEHVSDPSRQDLALQELYRVQKGFLAEYHGQQFLIRLLRG